MAGGYNDIENWFESSLLFPRLMGGYPWGKVYSVFLLVFQAMNIFVYSSVGIQLQIYYYPNSSLGNCITHVLFYSMEIISVFCVVTGGLLKEEVDRCLDQLMTVETSLRALGLTAEHKTVKYIGFDLVVAALSVLQAGVCIVLYENPFLNFYPTYIGLDMSLLIVYGRLCVFKLLLGALEEKLGRLVHGMSTKAVSRVECLAEQAEVLCSLAVRIHAAFTPFTTLALSVIFMCSVVSAYYACTGFEMSRVIEPCYTLVNAFVCYFIILRVVSGCVAVKNKVF